jgi:hypothetical protein
MDGRLRRRILLALAVVPWFRVSPAFGQPSARTPVPGALGYLPWWMAGGFQAMPWQKLDRVVLFDAPVQADGNLQERDWALRVPGLAEQAGGANVRFDIALTVLAQDQFDRLFGDAEARGRLLANALRWIESASVAGLHLDIEGFSAARPDAIAGFRTWLGSLDEARRAAGKVLSAFFPASDDFVPYDAEAARRIDFWVAQVYDAHAMDAKVTGPLVTRMADNPVALPRVLARLAALGVSRRAILLSVPLYGWEWPSETDNPGAAARGEARLLTFAETPESLMPNDRRVATQLARRHGLRRDREHTPYFAYRDGTRWIQGWYEDLPSLTRKFAPERTQGYAGLAFFALGYDQGEIIDPLLRWWRSRER